MRFLNKQSGVTLIELTVVLLVLVALAGVAIPYLHGTGSAAMCKATDVTMQNVKKVIMERYYLDTLGKFPQDLQGLTTAIPDYNLHYLFSDSNIPVPPATTPARTHKPFDPATQTGWRTGGYLQGGITLTSGQNYSAENLDISFTDTTKGFVNSPLINGDIIILDGWGRPIIIQVDSNNIARLVSAGSGDGVGLIDNNNNHLAKIETLIGQNRPTNSDDRILYLNAPTPATDVNPSCDEN